jgi:hypothetical protein
MILCIRIYSPCPGPRSRPLSIFGLSHRLCRDNAMLPYNFDDDVPILIPFL